jgi:CRISPR-associated protein Csb2
LTSSRRAEKSSPFHGEIMLAIEIELLMGRYISAKLGARDVAEWPPHPQRLFSALVAAHFELEMGSTGEGALKWLENLPPPEICADLEPGARHAVNYWVPVNDESVRPDREQRDFRNPLERRNRQERCFPSVVPRDSIIVFQWPNAEGLELHREALERLIENVSYLGHSSSPVRACIRNRLVQPTIRPSAGGENVMRVPGPGRFDRLAAVYQLRLKDESIQPPIGRTASYETATFAGEAHSVFSTQALRLAFESGPRLALDSSLPLMQRCRDAVLSRLQTPALPCLSGHAIDGGPTTEPHLSFVPLANLDNKYSDGSLKGVALVLPRGVGTEIRRRLSYAVGKSWNLHLGPLGNISVRYIADDTDVLTSLEFSRYCERSSNWATVTPIALDRHPKRNGPSAEQIIADSCSRIGLPAPCEVRISDISAISGAPRVRDFHGNSKQTAGRVLTHALLKFETKIRGPVLLGAGRFIGLGVCLALDKRGRI